jgi:hypothetical protein
MNLCYWQDGMGLTLSSTLFSATKLQLYRRVAFLGPGFQPPRLRFVIDSPCLFGARFSVGTDQLSRRLALPFWGQVFSHQDSLFGARFSAATDQLCRLLVIAFLGPGFQPPRLMFFVESPFWGSCRITEVSIPPQPTQPNRFRLLSRVSTQAAFV